MKLNILKLSFLFTLIVIFSCNQAIQKDEEASKKITATKSDSGVYFINIKDGEKVQSSFVVEMGVEAMEIEPADKIEEGKGHHHIIIDGSYIKKGESIPENKTNIHYGKGQIFDTLKLNPGIHTLTLQFGNGVHQSYGKDWSNTITVEVEE